MGFLSSADIEAMGFSRVGANVRLSDKASYYNCRNIAIGDNVRIDDFCVLSAGAGGIEIQSHVHIAVYCLLTGAGKITLCDFSGLSSRVSVYSSSDDYSGASLTNPTVPDAFKGVVTADVCLGRHVIVGSGSVILPGVVLGDGVAVGALSLVSKSCPAFGIYSGVPARRIKERRQALLSLEARLLAGEDKPGE
ncbi:MULTISPECIES: acyltransferase [Pseudomonas]|uniref:acyltransferase n=1 Tax=Pseudomonas TaxID=286 RepID=UPI0006455EEA|nr:MULTISPECIES: acyltransferase [Pseudomonas]AYN09729.1 galactoside O-acetyltransferase [Pseudomonas putida]EKT4477197.1 acyltransferase [Pseudomonas putida]MCX2707315.1 acyltransferase [Pseudomonas sp. DCB_BG]MDD2140484.1 acyltransferase [Pseudomonas putida]MDD2144796.1 acyltransferase [Pseudomonas putida]